MAKSIELNSINDLILLLEQKTQCNMSMTVCNIQKANMLADRFA